MYKKSILTYFASFSVFLLLFNCTEKNNNVSYNQTKCDVSFDNSLILNCLNSANSEECFVSLLDLMDRCNNKETVFEDIFISDKQDYHEAICIELNRKYNDQLMKKNVFNLAVENYCMCACDFAKRYIHNQDDKLRSSYLDAYQNYCNTTSVYYIGGAGKKGLDR